MFALLKNILYNELKRVKDGVSLTTLNGIYDLTSIIIIEY